MMAQTIEWFCDQEIAIAKAVPNVMPDLTYWMRLSLIADTGIA